MFLFDIMSKIIVGRRPHSDAYRHRVYAARTRTVKVSFQAPYTVEQLAAAQTDALFSTRSWQRKGTRMSRIIAERLERSGSSRTPWQGTITRSLAKDLVAFLRQPDRSEGTLIINTEDEDVILEPLADGVDKQAFTKWAGRQMSGLRTAASRYARRYKYVVETSVDTTYFVEAGQKTGIHLMAITLVPSEKVKTNGGVPVSPNQLVDAQVAEFESEFADGDETEEG